MADTVVLERVEHGDDVAVRPAGRHRPVEQERRAEEAEMEWLEGHTPFKRSV